MDTEIINKKPTPPGAKALVIGLLMVIASLAIYFADVRMDSGIQYIVYAILGLGVVISINIYGKQVNHTATFGNYFAHGFKVSAIVALIMILYLVIFLQIFPDFKEKAMEQIKDKIKSDKDTTPDQVEQAMIMVRKGFTLFAVGGALLYNLLLGVVASLIGAAITKKGGTNNQISN